MSRCGFVTAPSVRGAAPTTRWCRPHARGSRISRRAARPAAPRRNLGANSIGQMGFAGSGLGCGWGSLCFSIFESAAEGTGFAGRVAGLSERGALFSAAGAVFRGNLASFPVAGCSPDEMGVPPFHAWTSMESGGTSMQSAGKTPRGGRGLSFLAPALHGARSVCLMSMAAFGFCVLLLLRLHLWGCVGSLASCASSRSFFSSLLLLNRTRLRSCRSRFTKRGSSMTEMGLGSFSWGGRLRM